MRKGHRQRSFPQQLSGLEPCRRSAACEVQRPRGVPSQLHSSTIHGDGKKGMVECTLIHDEELIFPFMTWGAQIRCQEIMGWLYGWMVLN